MLRHGVRLPSLEAAQKWDRKRNNRSSGKDYPDTEERVDIMANTQKHVVSETSSETVTPAGGETDNAVVSDFVRALQSNRTEIASVLDKPRPYTRIALEAAIPTA